MTLPAVKSWTILANSLKKSCFFLQLLLHNYHISDIPQTFTHVRELYIKKNILNIF